MSLHLPSEQRTVGDVQPVLRDVHAALEDLHGARLAKVVLYGSYARGEAYLESMP